MESTSSSDDNPYTPSSDDEVIDIMTNDGPRSRRQSENSREQVVVEDAESGADIGSMDMFALSWRSQVTPASVSTHFSFLTTNSSIPPTSLP